MEGKGEYCKELTPTRAERLAGYWMNLNVCEQCEYSTVVKV